MSAATETIAFLANYNSWRRGDETLEMPSPAEIGAAIDDAVNLLRKHDDLKARADSEARAVAGVNASLDAAIIRAWGISAERDQLRAEVERLKDQGHTAVALFDDLKAMQARAERAEAELASERARLDYVMRVCYATNREAIDAAMKEKSG